MIKGIEQSYRASIAAIMVNKKKQFLFSRLKGEKKNRWDFVKGGMNAGEDESATLRRELSEELGSKINYDIIKESNWYLVYSWPEALQKERGFRGQARKSYWVLYKEGEIILNTEELEEYCWVDADKVYETMKTTGFPEYLCRSFQLEWQIFEKEFENLFK